MPRGFTLPTSITLNRHVPKEEKDIKRLQPAHLDEHLGQGVRRVGLATDAGYHQSSTVRQGSSKLGPNATALRMADSMMEGEDETFFNPSMENFQGDAPMDPTKFMIGGRQKYRKVPESSIQFRFPSTSWYCNYYYMAPLVLVLLGFISLKADADSPWFWRKYKDIFVFVFGVTVSFLEFFWMDVLIVLVLIVVLAFNIIRYKAHFKSKAEKIKTIQIYTAWIAWMSENTATYE